MMNIVSKYIMNYDDAVDCMVVLNEEHLQQTTLLEWYWRSTSQNSENIKVFILLP